MLNVFKSFVFSVSTALLLGAGVLVAAPAYAQVVSNTSGNWSGYIASDTLYSGVGGTWVVPAAAAATQPLAADATWVGIGGVSSSDLIQAGTQAITQNGSVSYQAWYETLPSAQHLIPLAVHAGDSVSVSLTNVSPDTWQLVFTNNTTGQQYIRTISYASSLSSAEWIEEMPTAISGRNASFVPLDQFGSVAFTNAYAEVNGSRVSLGQLDAQPITMASHGVPLATTSGVGSDAESFSVSRTDASAGSTSFEAYPGRTGVSVSGYAPHRRIVRVFMPNGSSTADESVGTASASYAAYVRQIAFMRQQLEQLAAWQQQVEAQFTQAPSPQGDDQQGQEQEHEQEQDAQQQPTATQYHYVIPISTDHPTAGSFESPDGSLHVEYSFE